MRNRQREKGHVAVVVAALLVVLFGFTSLAVDVGVFYTSRTAAQRAVDAAALAGAFTFVVNPTAPQPATARQHALSVAVAQQILGRPVDAANVDINVNVGSRLVTVNLTYEEGTYFARALGIAEAEIGVRAIAEAAPNSTGATCGKPWFIPNTMLSGLSPCAACAAGQVLIANNEVTSFGFSHLGQQVLVRPRSPANRLGPGQFYSIQMAGSSGANDYRNNIATCVAESLACQEKYSVETGNMAGPTVQGVNDLLGPSPDVWVDVGQYRRANGTFTDTGRQLVAAPIWDVCGAPGFCPDEDFPNGTKAEVHITGFALIFLEGVQGNDVMGRVVNISSCGGPLSTNEAAPFSIPVRLVRVPSGG